MIESRRVADTNLLVSRLLAPRGVAARAVDCALDGGILLVSSETLDELVAVLSRPRFDRYITQEDRHEFIRLLASVSRLIPVRHRTQACRDPKDNKILDVALNGEADVIITGDNDLLVLHPYLGIPILSPAEFLARHENSPT
jgi:putative PIN family toxin of toxin-antitoxin system